MLTTPVQTQHQQWCLQQFPVDKKVIVIHYSRWICSGLLVIAFAGRGARNKTLSDTSVDVMSNSLFVSQANTRQLGSSCRI